MKGTIYVRVSNSKEQERMCREHCRRKGITDVRVIKETGPFKDHSAPPGEKN